MIEKKLLRNITIILLLTMPLFCVGVSSIAPEHSVWIVRADRHDGATDLAIQTLIYELDSTKSDIRQTTLSGLESVPLQVDVLVLVGHGQPQGIRVTDNIIPWPEMYDALAERQPQKTIVLACDSPSDPDSNLFGFGERIDAEAGAIIASWLINQEFTERDDMTFPFERVSKAQYAMQNPLGRYLYFVHGYWGADSEYDNMMEDLEDRDIFEKDYKRENVKFFSYFEFYAATEEGEKNFVHNMYSVSSFATNFYNEILTLPTGSQVNIIAHSMGGIIVREMLRLYRTDLDTAGMNIGKIITLGTPHQGSRLANPDNNWAAIVAIIGGYLTSPGHLWPSSVFHSLQPASTLMILLNWDPLDYSSGIDWYTISGFNEETAVIMFTVHGTFFSDPIVAQDTAHLSFATDTMPFETAHGPLIKDGTTFDLVFQWITEGEDSDNDGLTDDSEIYFHGTDPNDLDTDGDFLSDYAEIVEHQTDPTDSDSDNDGVNDYEEVEVHGSNPNDSDTDDDNMPDGWEIQYGLNPLVDDIMGDPDDDDLINLFEYQFNSDPTDSDSDDDGLIDGAEYFMYYTDPNDSDTDDDSLGDYEEIYTHSTNPTLWSTDGDILSDAQEIAWGYDPCDSSDPIPASSLIYISRHSAGKVGYVYANHYTAMDYIKVYVRYRFSAGFWTGYSYVGSDYTPYSSGDYYVSWGLLSGTVRMQVRVEAYDSSNHYLGSDSIYVTLPDDGGGDPPPL
ncbi:MAG: DUF7379 domain-containing protein [Candidatus Thorarchaeota archaeon]